MSTYKRQMPGKRVSASIINQGVEARELLDKITVAPGLNITTGKNGIVISLATSIPGRELGISTSTITTASGTTPGSGTVALYQGRFDGSAALPYNVEYTVYNWSENKSVDSGVHVMICKIHGVWFVDWADCS